MLVFGEAILTNTGNRFSYREISIILSYFRKKRICFSFNLSLYSPILTSEGPKVRRFHDVAREMEFRINTANRLSIALRYSARANNNYYNLIYPLHATK